MPNVTQDQKIVLHTLEWFPSMKNSASVRPAPVLMGGALNSSYTPPSPCVCSSSTSVRPVSANVFTPLDARAPRRNSTNDLLCERPAHTRADTVQRRMTRHGKEVGIGEEETLLRFFGHSLEELTIKTNFSENCRFIVRGSRKLSQET